MNFQIVDFFFGDFENQYFIKIISKWSQNGPECVFAHFWTKNTKITDLKILKKKWKNRFFKNLIFFAHIEIHKDIVNQIPGPGYNRKFKKVRTQFFFTSILESLLFTFISRDFGHFLVRFLEYLVNARPKIRNFRKSSNLKSHIFKTIWTFSKVFGVLESRWIGLSSWAS